MTESKKKSLKLNMGLNAIKGLMSIIFPLISFPYISRVIGVENIGRFNFSNSIISYFVLFAGLGISTYAIREGARFRESKGEFQKFANEMFSINIVSTVLSYALLIVLFIAIPRFQGYKSLLIILSLQVIFKAIGIEWIYSIYEDYAYITVRSILFQILSLILMFLLVHSENDLNIYAAITVFSSVGSNVLNFFYAKRYCEVRWTNKIRWRKHIKPIMVLFAMSATVAIYVISDTTILGLISGDYSVGVYSVSTKVYGIIKTVLASVLVVSIPHLSSLLGNNDMSEFNYVATDIYQTLLTLLLPTATGIIILRKQIVLLISDSTYIAATTSLALLSIALIFCLGAWFWGQCILVPMKKENIVFKATFTSAVLNIVLNFILIPKWTENAAAFTTVLAEGLAFLWCMSEGKKYVHLKDIGKTTLKVIIGCSAIVLISLLLKPLNQSSILYTILTVGVSIIAYFLIEIKLNNAAMNIIMIGAMKKIGK
ncbi:O-antigen/teichoic acid export membrane protein [Trichococcus patagoniensis]|uniref:O-antigen/teichoic acid export membrane protein n=1 Tax=Trichococcus patagoniensis TaxID=382641 RepID=A0A2T5IQ41_9LACT|nr:flippase [Trichococcus patagoniensis]PTQ85942.1 O-antigen/teichoic acid export membrane protein [Trichococcus patagoniensis]